LGLTSAYGLGDTELTRQRIEADLTTLVEFRHKYNGLLADSQEKLAWDVSTYANAHAMLPRPPELLVLEETNAGMALFGIILIAICLLGTQWTSPWVESYVGLVDGGVVINIETGERRPLTPDMPIVTSGHDVATGKPAQWVKLGHWHQGFFKAGDYPDWAWPWWLLFFGFVCCGVIGLVFPVQYLLAVKANGDRPRENARRRRIHEEAMVAAMAEADKRKAADDHRRRAQIRELEGEIAAIDGTIAEVRRLLRKGGLR